MVDANLVLTIAAELLLIAVGGFWAGKLFHILLVRLLHRFTLATRSHLDDVVLQYTETPLKIVSVMLFVFFFSGLFENLSFVNRTLSTYSLGILVLLASYLLAETVGALLRWYYREGLTKKQASVDFSLIPVLRKISRVVIVFAGLMAALAIVGVDVTGVLTVTSVVALILGLASQETLSNFFAGLALQLDRPYQYGNFLRLPSGEVVKLQKIGIRSTKLEDLNGNDVVISNSEFAKFRITNLSKPSPGFNYSLALEADRNVDLDRFEAFVLQAIRDSPMADLKKRDSAFRVEKIGRESVIVSVDFWVSDYNTFLKAKDQLNREFLAYLNKPESKNK